MFERAYCTPTFGTLTDFTIMQGETVAKAIQISPREGGPPLNLGGYEVKLHATPLLASAIDVPGGFEVLRDVAPGGGVIARPSDRTPPARPTPSTSATPCGGRWAGCPRASAPWWCCATSRT